MTDQRKRLIDLLGIEETKESKIRHLQNLRTQAENRVRRGQRSYQASMEQSLIDRIDAEIAREEPAVNERQEMVEEAGAIIAGGRHPWMMCLKALEAEDEEVAEAVLEAGRDCLSPREKIAASAMKRTFAESPEEWRGRRDKAHEEYRSEIGEALANKIAGRRTQQEKILAHSRPSRGINAPLGEPEDDHRYIQASPGGAELPVSGYSQTDNPRGGRGREKVRRAYPQGT